MAAEFTWVQPLAVVTVGAVLGVLFVVVRSRSKGPVSRPATTNPEPSDLKRQYDALIRRLAEGVDDAEKAAIETEAARVLMRLDGSASAPIEAPPASARERPAVNTQAAKPASAFMGFLYGVLTMAILGGLVYFASQGSAPRTEGGGVTGGPPARDAAQGTQAAAEADDPSVIALEEAVRKTPTNIAQRIELTRAYMQKRDLIKVFDQTKAVLEIEPGNPQALTYQALVRVAMGQADQAETMLLDAIKKDPKIEDAYIHLAIARIQLGNRKGAEEAIQEGQKRFPDDKEQLAQVFAQISAAADEKSAPGAPPKHPDVDAPAEMASTSASSPAVVVVVDLPKGVTVPPGALLFVIVREAGFETGPPVAVRRIPAINFPITVSLSDKDSMAGESLPGLVRIDARVDRDGDPLTKDPRDPVAAEDNVRRGAGQTFLVLGPPRK